MGAWGSGSFQNDAALDWLIDLEQAGTLGPVHQALQLVAVAEPAAELDADDASAAVAAAEVVAALNGAPAGDLPEEVAAWVAPRPAPVGQTLLDQALAAVRRVRADSELSGLWEDPGWHATLDLLEARLLRPPRAEAAG